MRYTYRAKNESGEIVEDMAEAPDTFALARELRKKGLHVVSSTQEKGDGAKNSLSLFLDRFSRVRYVDKMQLFGNLTTMLSAGLSLSRALAVLSRQTHNDALQRVLETMIEHVDRGESLADTLLSFGDMFSRESVELVRAGETSGALPETLKRIAETMKRRYDIVRKIKGAMTYPIIVIVLMIAIGFFMLVVVVPPLTQTFLSFEVELPLLTRVIIGAGTFVSNNILLTLFSGIAIFVGVYRMIRSKPGMRLIHTWVLKLPWIATLAREYYAGASLRTISSLLASGIDIVESLEISANAIANHHYHDALIQASKRVQKGVPVHVLFLERPDLFPSFVAEMAEVGGETGLLSKMLDQAANVYDEHIADTTKNISSIIEPILMVIIGLFVAIFAIAVIDPLYSLTESLQ